MRRRAFHACALTGLGLLLAPGCKKPDTILLVELYGPMPPELEAWQFRVTISAGLSSGRIDVPKQPRPSPLPQSFTIALDQSHTGPIEISVVALDMDFLQIAFGTTKQEHVVIGGQTVIPVYLTLDVPPEVADAGAGGSDAGDAAVGQDAGGDATDDGMGLDDAAD